MSAILKILNEETGEWEEVPAIVGPPGATGPAGPAGADGKDGADGYTPVKGTDYFTDADIEEVAATAAAKVDATGAAANLINRATAVNTADTNYTTLMARGEKLLDATTFDAVTDWSTHLVNGAIAWRYE